MSPLSAPSNNLSSLRLHATLCFEQISSKKRTYHCYRLYCQFYAIFASRSRTRRDIQLHATWKCFICTTFFALTLRVLMSHYYSAHSNGPNFWLKCGVNDCPATFRRYHSFYKHVVSLFLKNYVMENRENMANSRFVRLSSSIAWRDIYLEMVETLAAQGKSLLRKLLSQNKKTGVEPCQNSKSKCETGKCLIHMT